MNRQLTLVAVVTAVIGTAGLLHAQEGSPERQESKDMAGAMQMSPEKVHHRMMMRTKISRHDPAALMALRDELELSEQQVRQLERQLAQAREAALAVLTEEQRQAIEPLPAEPRSIMQMRKMMMDRMGGDGMEGMCPMCRMMAEVGMPQDGEGDNEPADRVDLDAKAQSELDRVVEAYLSINQQLVNDRMEGVAARFEQVQRAARSLAAAAPQTLSERVEAVERAAAARPRTITEAREALETLSAAVIDVVTAAPPSDAVAEELYVAYCPMAEASWLQQTEKVVNPYMGQRMLACGSVKQTIETNE